MSQAALVRYRTVTPSANPAPTTACPPATKRHRIADGYDPVRRLAAAVLTMAYEDLVRALRRLEAVPDDTRALATVEDCRRFCRGEGARWPFRFAGRDVALHGPRLEAAAEEAARSGRRAQPGRRVQESRLLPDPDAERATDAY